MIITSIIHLREACMPTSIGWFTNCSVHDHLLLPKCFVSLRFQIMDYKSHWEIERAALNNGHPGNLFLALFNILKQMIGIKSDDHGEDMRYG